MSSNDHNFQSPSSTTTGDELHRQTHTPSPMTTPPPPSTTPESRIAAAIGDAIATIPSTSFKEAIANITTTKKPLIRTISDANSSVVNQDSSKTTTLTPPTNTHVHCPIPRALLSDIMMTSTDRHQQPQIMTTRPNKPAVRRALPDTAEYQQSKKMTPPPVRKSSSSPTVPPPSSIGIKSPYSEVVKKIEEMVRECMVMLSEQEHVENLDHGNTKPSPGPSPSPSQPQAMEEEEEEKKKEECVGVERDLGTVFRVICCCFEDLLLLYSMLISRQVRESPAFACVCLYILMYFSLLWLEF